MRGKPELKPFTDRHGKRISDNWYIFYFDGERSRRVSTGYRIGTQDHEANLALAQFTLEREKPIARTPDSVLIAQALKDYFVEHGQYKATGSKMAYHEGRINAAFPGFISTITKARIEKYVRDRQGVGESNGTIRKDLEHLKASINHEIGEGRLLYGPKIKMPPPPPARSGSLSDAQIDLIAKAAKSQHIKDFTYLAFDTGQRPGAIENLKWFQVDFKTKIINFDLIERAGRIVEREQSNKRVRPVPMSDRVLRILKRLFKVKKTEYVLEYYDIIRKEVRPAGCVKKAFNRACDDAGVEASRYTIRHAFANRDMDETTRSQFMGHTNQKTTRENYIKVNIPKMREALKKVKKS